VARGRGEGGGRGAGRGRGGEGRGIGRGWVEVGGEGEGLGEEGRGAAGLLESLLLGGEWLLGKGVLPRGLRWGRGRGLRDC